MWCCYWCITNIHVRTRATAISSSFPSSSLKIKGKQQTKWMQYWKRGKIRHLLWHRIAVCSGPGHDAQHLFIYYFCHSDKIWYNDGLQAIGCSVSTCIYRINTNWILSSKHSWRDANAANNLCCWPMRSRHNTPNTSAAICLGVIAYSLRLRTHQLYIFYKSYKQTLLQNEVKL